MMQLWGVIRFEMEYQARRAWTWVYAAALFLISLQITLEAYAGAARDEGFYFNSPFVIASMTVLGSVMGLLIAAALTGEAGARDTQERMFPLVYTSPVSKPAYLVGRFFAAYSLNALIQLVTQLALVVSMFLGIPDEIRGPIQPLSYIASYLIIGLPNAFIATALMFSASVLSRRAITSYLIAILLFFVMLVCRIFVAGKLGNWELAKLLDPLMITPLSEIASTTLPADKNALSLILNFNFLPNRMIWLGLAVLTLGIAVLRFRFAHPAQSGRSRGAEEAPAPGTAIRIPRPRIAFGLATNIHQGFALAVDSFRTIAFSWGGLVLLLLGLTVVLFGPSAISHAGIPILPTTREMTAFVGNTGEILWMIVPLLSAFYAGELVWRERDAGISEIADAAPVPDWVRMIGRLCGLFALLIAYQVLLMVGCMLVQTQLGYYQFEIPLYLRVMLGVQLAEHISFAVLALAVHALVNHKYAGHMVVLIAFGAMTFATSIGIEHKLLVYGAAPAWSYSDMRGFGSAIVPWLWFKLYWAAWAALLAWATTWLWVRGKEQGMAARIRSGRVRLTRKAAATFAGIAAAIVVLGGFAFYNTNVLNDFDTTEERNARRAEYERRYARFAHAPQPQLTRVRLDVALHPDRNTADITGAYVLVNRSATIIDTLHFALEAEVETGPMQMSKQTRLVTNDERLGHRIYALARGLQPGDSMSVHFTARYRPNGFTNDGVDDAVADNGTFIEATDWLPSPGYKEQREISDAGERRRHKLPARREYPSLDDTGARFDVIAAGAETIVLETTISTTSSQTAIAPGTLRRSWTAGGRRFFHYITDSPIRNDYALFSADYKVHKGQWKHVPIEIVHHPAHHWNAERMVRGIQASLDYFTRHFSPYPYRQVRLVEHAGDGTSLHAYPINVGFQEGFAVMNPDTSASGLEFPFAVVAHEMAHEWWGGQLSPAFVEGGGLLSEGLAWYSAYLVVEETFGEKQLDRLRAWMSSADQGPRSNAAPPLLRASGWHANYRRGPAAMFAVREYIGEEKVNVALRALLGKHGRTAPLPVSLDLYRELKAVTPDSLQYLLHDLFAANTIWDLSVERVASQRLTNEEYRVDVDVKALKSVVDTAGVVTGIPMRDLIEIGVYDADGKVLHLAKHRIGSGSKRISLTVRGEPKRAGIDPRRLLNDVEPENNLQDVGTVKRRL